MIPLLLFQVKSVTGADTWEVTPTMPMSKQTGLWCQSLEPWPIQTPPKTCFPGNCPFWIWSCFSIKTSCVCSADSCLSSGWKLHMIGLCPYVLCDSWSLIARGYRKSIWDWSLGVLHVAGGTAVWNYLSKLQMHILFSLEIVSEMRNVQDYSSLHYLLYWGMENIQMFTNRGVVK